MLKVFHIISAFDLGGAERVAINISKSKNKNFQYHVFEVVKGNSAFTDSMVKEMVSNGIFIHRSFVKSKKFAIIFFPLWFVFSYVKEKPNIIHTHTEVPDLSIYLFYQLTKIFRLKVKFVRTIHNTKLWTSWKTIGKYVEKFYIKQHSNIAISSSTKLSYKNSYNQKEIPIIFNGVEMGTSREFTHLKPNKINVLFAGRFEYQKGIDQLCQVIKLLENNETYFFHVVGSGSLEQKIFLELKDSKNVSIYPKIYNLSQYLPSFDFLFMPSNYEGLGLMSIEASLSKTPVIINDTSGLVETLPLDWKLKVHNNSVDEYLTLFNKVIPEIDKELLINDAYKYVEKNFKIDHMQAKYETIYYNLINKDKH